MGFGAIITSEDQNTPLSDDLLKWLVEARVEQELSAPTRFAIRFEDDTCEGSLQVLKAKEIKPNTVMAILAPDGNKLACLVRGRVTQVRFAVMLGVAGSWVEIRGEDRRIEMDRHCVHKAWRGLASDAANTILNDYHFRPDVEATKKLYSDREHTLNQRDTDLAFLERIARENGYEFWIEYGVKDSASTPGAPIGIDETAKLRASPPRDAAPVPPIFWRCLVRRRCTSTCRQTNARTSPRSRSTPMWSAPVWRVARRSIRAPASWRKPTLSTLSPASITARRCPG
jgi:hypothetical protein